MPLPVRTCRSPQTPFWSDATIGRPPQRRPSAQPVRRGVCLMTVATTVNPRRCRDGRDRPAVLATALLAALAYGHDRRRTGGTQTVRRRRSRRAPTSRRSRRNAAAGRQDSPRGHGRVQPVPVEPSSINLQRDRRRGVVDRPVTYHLRRDEPADDAERAVRSDAGNGFGRPPRRKLLDADAKAATSSRCSSRCGRPRRASAPRSLACATAGRPWSASARRWRTPCQRRVHGRRGAHHRPRSPPTD